MTNPKKSYQLVKNAIEQILNNGGENNILRIELPNDYYMQMLCDKGSNEILMEAVSNNFLEEHNKLSDGLINLLIEIGWKAPNDENENFKIEATITNEIELNSTIEIILRTGKDVYGNEFVNQNMIDLELDN